MRRKIPRPYGQSVTPRRLISMLFALAVMWLLYDRLKDPTTWRGFAADDEAISVAVPTVESASSLDQEHLVPGPNDQDEDEVAAIQELFENVIDRSPLKSRDMDSYWRLMDWSRTQPFAEQEQRARRDVPFTQLWEQPERYRGRLIRLRMHVRRVLEYEAPENPAGIKQVCEAWGWTDESRSFPYVVVFPEPPNGLPIGTDVRTEIVFVGYFLKVMSYTAFDNPRGAPLLVGRAQLVATPGSGGVAKSDPLFVWLIVLGSLTAIGGMIGWGMWSRGKPKVRMLPDELSADGSFDSLSLGPSLDSARSELTPLTNDAIFGNYRYGVETAPDVEAEADSKTKH